jgi:outer membrane immunogenic protein
MRTVRLAGIALLTLAAGGTALAADLGVPVYRAAPLPVAFSWSGCYAGIFAGGALAERHAASTELATTNPVPYNAAGNNWSYEVGSSVIGGGTIGCNYQPFASRFVFGIEAEAGYLHLDGSAVDPLSPFLPLDTFSHTTIGDWYAVLAGRFGVSFDRVLVYVKGGAAFTRVRTGILDTNVSGASTATMDAFNDEFWATWTAGAGIEYAFSYNWSVKAEYLYIDTRSSESACGVAGGALAGLIYCWQQEVPGLHTVKVGLNYRFSGPAVAPVVARY